MYFSILWWGFFPSNKYVLTVFITLNFCFRLNGLFSLTMKHLVLYLLSPWFDLPLLIAKHRISELSFPENYFATQCLDVFQIVLCDINSSIHYVEIVSALEFVQVITCRVLIWITETGLNFLRLGINFTALSTCRFFQIIILYLLFTYTLRARQKRSWGRWKMEGEEE